ncbi:phosphate uptake regulator PhoU [Candidatus Woesearchaeota archaeon]|nr:phosphate uptake regulator PhoU [Candidatus Woesearchaeota archaeon]
MNIRKLVKSGAASHTIALPKDWLTKNKLNKGDLLYIVERDNELVISSETKQPKQSTKEISVEIDDKEINTIRRQTISAYINNYHLFTFHGNSLNKKLEEIRKILQNFLALEIVEQTATKLVAKDFLNLQEFSLPNTIRRMDMLTRSIITDAKKGKKESQALQFRDYEVDKLFFLISRLIRANLSDPASKLSNVKAMSTWWLAKSLESVSDSAKNISQYFNKDIEEFYNEAEQFYLECIKAYVKSDKELADNMIAERVKLLKKCDNIKGEQKQLLKGLINNSRNIAKIVLDGED